MKNSDKWKPSKFVFKKGKLIASRDRKEVGIASRLIGDLVAERYAIYIEKYANGKLIDLGCGKVPLFQAYREYVADNICVDWENSLHDNEFLDFKCDLTKRLPFEDAKFDTIILSDVLEHIPQPENLWKEMSRILAEDGKILMNVPFYYWIHEHPYDYYRYTRFALQRFVKIAGLKVILLEQIGGVPEILADILAKNLLTVPKIGMLLAIALQQAMLFFRKIKIGEKISRKTSVNFPLGYFLIATKYQNGEQRKGICAKV